VLDCAPRLGRQGIDKAIERAEALRVFDRCELEDLLARLRGQRGAAVVRAVLEACSEPDWTENDYEAAVLALVRGSGLPDPICQAPMVLRHAFERDHRRDQLLRLAGYEPLRITWRQLSRHPEQVEELLRELLAGVS
jgi:hypothetical protein